MNASRSRTVGAALAVVVCFFAANAAFAQSGSNPAEVKKIFETNCLECHGGRKTSAGVKILDRDVLVTKKKKIVPNKPDKSRLFEIITSKDDSERMPPSDRAALSARDVATIRAWILDGAPDFNAVAVKVEPKKDDQPLADLPPDDVKGIPVPKDGLPKDLPKDAPPQKTDVIIKSTAKAGSTGEPTGASVKAIFAKRCIECHGDKEPRADLKILDRSGLLKPDGVVVAGKPDKSKLFERVSTKIASDRMPPGKRDPLSSEELAVVQAWIAAGAPDFDSESGTVPGAKQKVFVKKPLGNDYVLQSIQADVRKLAARDLRSARYFSLAHLVTAGIDADDLQQHRDALAKAVNHLTWRRDLFRPTPVDAEQVIFRVDVAELGWQREVLKPAAGQGTALNAWDVMLLEYPYGLTQADDPAYRALASSYLVPSGMVRPVPCVRGDWFVSAAMVPPLYHEMLFLPRTLEKLEEGLGVNSQQNIDTFRAVRGGVLKSGVSQHNRVVERHTTNFGGYYWRSYDFNSSAGKKSIATNPVQLQPDGGEMIFSLPNGMQAYLIVDKAGRRIDAAPTAVVIDKLASDKTVRNGLSCIRCHERGMQGFEDVIRSTVESLPDNPGFDKTKALRLYRDGKETEGLLKTDEDTFMKKMEKLLGKPQESDPVKPVSTQFLDTKLNIKAVAAELGLTDDRGLSAVFRRPEFLEIGLAPLPSGQEVAREAWEQYFDEAARRVGAGLPVVPLDAASRPNYEPLTKPFTIAAATNKKGDVFQTGEDMEVFVKASKDVFIEVVHTAADGKKTILVPSTTKITAKEAFRLTPKARPIKLSSKPGVETITILACEVPFVGGEVMNGFGVPNRVIHRSAVREENGRMIVTNGPPPTRTVKKTLTIEVK